jgi:catechol 2,3-dioxygenase-like lactoylglutathione lyase family enzyme
MFHQTCVSTVSLVAAGREPLSFNPAILASVDSCLENSGIGRSAWAANLPIMNPDGFDSQITFVYTGDLGRSAAFYGQQLGLELARDQGACLIYRVTSDAYLGVCTHHTPNPGGIILTLVTDDVDGWAARLRAADVEVDGPHANARFELYHCFVHDPDGHLVEIQRFDNPL